MRYRFDKNRMGLMIHVWEEFFDVLNKISTKPYIETVFYEQNFRKCKKTFLWNSSSFFTKMIAIVLIICKSLILFCNLERSY